MEAARKLEYYTYADYCTWDSDERWELIDGVPCAMAPAPSVAHQSISRRLIRQLDTFLHGKPCEVFYAPIDVRLNADKGDDTVVQPDIIVVCDKSKLEDGKAVIGVPDLVIEILSPSTARLDRITKLTLYRRSGVREYWIVDPDSKAVSVHVLRDGEYIVRAYSDGDSVPVHVLEGCNIDLPQVFIGGSLSLL